MEDFRLYYYEYGQLKKVGRGKKDGYLHESLESARARVTHLKGLADGRWFGNRQFVIVQYFEVNSKIIEII